MRVLVVEDDLSIRETLAIVLEAYDHQADLVESGEKALEHLHEAWPDVMLLDLTLQGMSGEELYQAILTRYGRVPPTVVLSGVQQGAVRAQKMPGVLFLSKPYTLNALANMINLAVTQKGVA